MYYCQAVSDMDLGGEDCYQKAAYGTRFYQTEHRTPSQAITVLRDLVSGNLSYQMSSSRDYVSSPISHTSLAF